MAVEASRGLDGSGGERLGRAVMAWIGKERPGKAGQSWTGEAWIGEAWIGMAVKESLNQQPKEREHGKSKES